MDNLNAGAVSFTPGGDSRAPPPSEYEAYSMEDTSDGAMLDEIEAAILAESQEGGGGGGGGANVTYADLPPHANEFWFPECRDCNCCKGYKHGCQCCTKEGKRSCKCAPSTGPTTTASVPPPTASWQPAAPGPGTGGGSGYNTYGRPGGGRGTQMCRFFTSPGGCRFGDSCRFSHG